MIALLAVTATVAPSPTPQVVSQIVNVIKEVPMTPDYINQLLIAGGLFLAGWLFSWVQSFINSRKQLAEKVNVVITAFYTIIAPTAIVLWQEGQLDLSTPTKVLASVGVITLAAWVRYNGIKLTKPADTTVVAPEAVVPTRAVE